MYGANQGSLKKEFVFKRGEKKDFSDMTSLIEREQASLKSPRSPGRPTSGQFSFKGSLYVANNEKDWIEIQKNTFTNWCNVQIQPYGVQITSDLAEAFKDGLSLVYLVESISTKKVGRYNKNPKLYAQKLENITSALKLLQNDGIKLVNIGKPLNYFVTVVCTQTC